MKLTVFRVCESCAEHMMCTEHSCYQLGLTDREICKHDGVRRILVPCSSATCEGHVILDAWFHGRSKEANALVSESKEKVKLIMTECKHVPEDPEAMMNTQTGEMKPYLLVTASGLSKETAYEKVRREQLAHSYAPRSPALVAAAAATAAGRRAAAADAAVAPKAKGKGKGRGRPRKNKSQPSKWVVDADATIGKKGPVRTSSDGMSAEVIAELAEDLKPLVVDCKDIRKLGEKGVVVQKDFDYSHLATLKEDGEKIGLKDLLGIEAPLTTEKIKPLSAAKLGVLKRRHQYVPVSATARVIATAVSFTDAMTEYKLQRDEAQELRKAYPEDSLERKQFLKIVKRAAEAYDGLNEIMGEATGDAATQPRGLFLCMNVAVQQHMLHHVLLDHVLKLIAPHAENNAVLKKFRTALLTQIKDKQSKARTVISQFAVSRDFTKVIEIGTPTTTEDENNSAAVAMPFLDYQLACSSVMVTNASPFVNAKEQRDCVKLIADDLKVMIPEILEKLGKADMTWQDTPAMRSILIQNVMDLAVRRRKAKNVALVLQDSLGQQELASAHVAQHMLTDEIVAKSARATSIIQMIQNTHVAIADADLRKMVQRQVVRMSYRGVTIDKDAVDPRAAEKPTKSKKQKKQPSEESDSDAEYTLDDEELEQAEADEANSDKEDDGAEMTESEDDDDTDVVVAGIKANADMSERLMDAHMENEKVRKYQANHDRIVSKRGEKRHSEEKEPEEAEGESEQREAAKPKPAKKRKIVEEDESAPAPAVAVAPAVAAADASAMAVDGLAEDLY